MDLEEKLEEFKSIILESYERRRIDLKLAKVKTVASPVRSLLEINGDFFIGGVGEGGELPPPAKIKSQSVEPVQVGFNVDISSWARDVSEGVNVDYSHVLRQMGDWIARREEGTIIKALLEKAGAQVRTEEEGVLTLDDIRAAENKIRERYSSPDTLIISPDHWTRLSKERHVYFPSQYPFFEFTEKGRRYDGMAGNLCVISTNLPENSAIVYQRDTMQLDKTELEVRIVQSKGATLLTLDETCSTAPIVKKKIVKINISH